MTKRLSELGLIFAPQGRDAMVARELLHEAGISAEIVENLPNLVAKLSEGAGFCAVTEEALSVHGDLHVLFDWIEQQPDWSDFPFILLIGRGGGPERNPQADRFLHILGNVTFLERPFHPTTFVSFARSSLRSRRRQYEARARLDELDRLASDLERRVEQRTAEHANAMAQLHEIQKLETLGQLTGGVAHDFNNLLTPITGALDLLNRKYSDSDPRSARLLANALTAADRAKTLLQRLLGFARRQTLRMQPTDIPSLLAGMRDLIASSVGPMVELRIRHAGDLPSAMIDPNQLELAILNLAVNARDAMPEGGPLTISVEEVAIGPHSSPRLRPGLYIRLSVIDAGCGMDPATVTRAVEPFYSTKELGQGTGLGLSMVHGLAAQLGGGFELTSALGEGTRVDLYLPAGSEDPVGSTTTMADPIKLMSRRLRVLLVDDELIVRTATAEMTRDLGHEVMEAGGASEALRMLVDGLEVDVVITDYMMPGLDGGKLAERIADSRPDLPVLLITGYAGPTDAALHLPRLGKPFGQAEIAAALADLFATDDKVVRFPHRKRPERSH